MSKHDPDWLARAKQYVGIREVRGPRHNPTIIRWLEKLNAWWREDETPRPQSSRLKPIIVCGFVFAKAIAPMVANRSKAVIRR